MCGGLRNKGSDWATRVESVPHIYTHYTHTHTRSFLVTKAAPPLFWRPAVHSKETDKLTSAAKKELDEWKVRMRKSERGEGGMHNAAPKMDGEREGAGYTESTRHQHDHDLASIVRSM